MKPITLTPAQMDAALGLPPDRPTWCWGPMWCDANPCTCAHPDQAPIVPPDVSGGHARAGKTAAIPPTVTRPRLKCTCAERDYGLCPKCRVSP